MHFQLCACKTRIIFNLDTVDAPIMVESIHLHTCDIVCYNTADRWRLENSVYGYSFSPNHVVRLLRDRASVSDHHGFGKAFSVVLSPPVWPVLLGKRVRIKIWKQSLKKKKTTFQRDLQFLLFDSRGFCIKNFPSWSHNVQTKQLLLSHVRAHIDPLIF